MTTFTDKDIGALTFKGEQDEWRGWKMMFLAYAEEKECEDSLLLDDPIPAVTANNTADEKAKIASNKKAMRLLAMSCARGKAQPYVELAKGNARVAWKSLVKRYERDDDADLIRLEKEFATCAIEDFPGPEEWMQQLFYLNL
jgi:hypothetical protein